MFKNTTAIGADIGRNSLRIAVINFGGEVFAVNTHILKEKQSADYLIKEVIEAVKEIRRQVAGAGINPICIGISAKGFIDHKNGIILGPDRGIKGWKDVPLARLVSSQTGLPVFAGNDANLMTVAEHRYGAAKNFNNVVFVALRTGIGGGIIINGKLYRGINNAGGEIGQMIINYDNGMSDKGIRGSFEHHASAIALVRRYLEISDRKKNKGSESLSGRDIFELSYRNEVAATKAVKENAELVGIGLANLITIFAPEIIVLGGGMSQARDSYISMIRKSAFENSLANCRAEVKIERAELGPDAPLMGGAYYSILRLSGKNI